MWRSRAVLIKRLCKKVLVLQTIELKVLECLALIWSSQARKERLMLQDSVDKYDSFVFPDSLKCVKPQQDSGVCYRYRSASEVFNVAYGFALHIF